MVEGEVHAKLGPDPSSSLGGEWRQTNKQTDRQTDTPFCFIYIDGFFDISQVRIHPSSLGAPRVSFSSIGGRTYEVDLKPGSEQQGLGMATGFFFSAKLLIFCGVDLTVPLFQLALLDFNNVFLLPCFSWKLNSGLLREVSKCQLYIFQKIYIMGE